MEPARVDPRLGHRDLLGRARTRRARRAAGPDGEAPAPRAQDRVGEPAQGQPALRAARSGDGGGAALDRRVPAGPQPGEPRGALAGARRLRGSRERRRGMGPRLLSEDRPQPWGTGCGSGSHSTSAMSPGCLLGSSPVARKAKIRSKTHAGASPKKAPACVVPPGSAIRTALGNSLRTDRLHSYGVAASSVSLIISTGVASPVTVTGTPAGTPHVRQGVVSRALAHAKRGACSETASTAVRQVSHSLGQGMSLHHTAMRTAYALSSPGVSAIRYARISFPAVRSWTHPENASPSRFHTHWQ